MANRSYHDQYAMEINLKIRELLKQLPPFCSLFFRGIEPTTQARTRMAYAYDLIVFFNYLKSETNICGNKEITELKIIVLDKVTPGIIQDYLEYLKVYSSEDENIRSNSERGLNRKLASIRSFYRYFYEMEMINTNPPSIVKMPKIHDKDIVRLEGSEISELLNTVEQGTNLTGRQKKYHEKTKTRDLAIITLLLGTGLRVSECVGLDITDVDFKNHGLRITRKGGNQVVVYFGDEVEEALNNYMTERMEIVPMPGHENALFLSMQKKRMSVHAIEDLVRKYSTLVTQLKKITPHKLRSTYGTQLYRETGDIYLVADVLGHSDVNTTKKHYAALEDERRRSARNKVTLRNKGYNEYNDDNVDGDN